MPALLFLFKEGLDRYKERDDLRDLAEVAFTPSSDITSSM
jgi:hypothetical protein